MSARIAIPPRLRMVINPLTTRCVRAMQASRYASLPIPRTLPGRKTIALPPVARRAFSSSSTNRHQKDDPSSHQTTSEKPKPHPLRHPLTLLATTLLTSYLLLNLALEYPPLDTHLTHLLVGRPLHPSHFAPFTVLSHEPVSPTAFLLTLRPKHLRDVPPHPTLLSYLFPRARFHRTPHPHLPALHRAWHHGLWSVEIKQPQLQVARDYTPLPPASEEELESGDLRFLIRRVRGGEVSTYLDRLPVGADVELRGPHLGFDVGARLGGEDRVVFLAGGTGVAPALQAVRALGRLERRPRVEVLWANRERGDCEVGVALLGRMKASYGEGLRWDCTVDEEGRFITRKDVVRAAGVTAAPAGRRWWRREGLAEMAAPASDVRPGKCMYHSPVLTALSAGEDPFAGDEVGARCLCVDQDGAAVAGGKKLLMVSGPEGFVTAFVGEKIWGEGKELQGGVGGLVGRLSTELGGWLVLKL